MLQYVEVIEGNSLDDGCFYIFRFVQYVAVIGGNSLEDGCFPPTSPEHSIILQYSTNGGEGFL